MKIKVVLFIFYLGFSSLSALGQDDLSCKLLQILFFEENELDCGSTQKLIWKENGSFAIDTTKWVNDTFLGRTRPKKIVRSQIKLQKLKTEILSNHEIDSSFYLYSRNSWSDSVTQEFIDTASFEAMEAAAERYTREEGYESQENRIYIQLLKEKGAKRLYIVNVKNGQFRLSVKLKRRDLRDVVVNKDTIFNFLIGNIFTLNFAKEIRKKNYSIKRLGNEKKYHSVQD